VCFALSMTNYHHVVQGLASSSKARPNNVPNDNYADVVETEYCGWNRRNALAVSAAALAAGFGVSPIAANAATDVATETVVDMAAINAARAKQSDTLPMMMDMNKINAARSSSSTGSTRIYKTLSKSIIPMKDPSPLLAIRSANGEFIQIPRVGYSFYKTPADQAARCTTLALLSGIRHLDVATSYGSNPEIAKSLKKYLDIGLTGLDTKEEKPELLEVLDATRTMGEQHAKTTINSGAGNSILSKAPIVGSAGRRGRRDALFLSHKLSNPEQSTDATQVRRSVKAAIATLGCSYLDMVSIHSPLTDKDRRLTTYQAFLDLRDSGFVKTVGVCNYGLGPLQEIIKAGLDLPAVNQLELSPFNAHKDVVEFCDTYGIAVSCAAWSKLSGADGPSEQWDVVAKLAAHKKTTKAQILVRWALQKGYICVPRSAAASKVERMAIAENSYGGVNLDGTNFVLTAEEMTTLDGLDVNYKAGKLGRRDGWEDSDVTGPDWDPTDFV